MALKLADAFVFLGAKREGLQKDLGEGKKDVTAWTVAVGTTVGNLMGGVIQKGAEVATKAVVGLGKSLVDMTMDAAQVEGVRNTFGRLVQSVGGDAVKAMGDLRAATRGMVADADLMAAGNKFLAMGLADSSEKAAELAEIATQLGMAMGEDATSSMENFALMLANQSIPRLDSFGISSGTVRTRIEELMAATEGLTREQAFMQAVMEQARVTMEKVGEQGETSAAKIAGIQATIENLRLVAGQALQPILDVFVDIANNLVQNVGPKITQWITETAKPAIEGLALALRGIAAGNFGDVLNGIEQALLALGVPSDTVERVITIINTFYSAFQDIKEGRYEEAIGKIKAALLEMGVPIGVIDGVEKAVRGVVAWVGENWPKAQEVAKQVWETVLKPALEGLKQLAIDLKPLFIALGAVLLLHVVGPMVLAALPVVALGAALIALGLIWKEHGDQVKYIVGQIGVIVSRVFSSIIEWVRNAIAAITSIEGPFGDVIRSIVGDGNKAISSLDKMIEKMREANKERAENLLAQPAPESNFNPQESLATIVGLLGGGNQDNRQSITVYGGVQQYGTGTGDNALAQLWNLGG